MRCEFRCGLLRVDLGRGLGSMILQHDHVNRYRAATSMTKRTGVDIVDPQILIMLRRTERTLLGIRAIDTAGYLVIWYITDFFPRGLGSRSTKDSSGG